MHEYSEIYDFLNNTGKMCPNVADKKILVVNKTINEIFNLQCARTPNANALIFKNKTISYRELNEEAQALASFLQDSGIKPESIIALCMNRSIHLVTSIIAILKLGAAYLPLDPQYPLDRIQFILEDSKAFHTIISGEYRAKFSGQSRIIDIDEFFKDQKQHPHSLCKAIPVTVQPHHLAYINYTSGSTGKPKGVEITHQSVVNLVNNQDFVQMDNHTVTLQFSTPAFDAFTFELFAPLLNGGTCVLFPDKIPTLKSIGRIIKEYQINTAFITASLFNAIIDEEPHALEGLKKILVGGEALSVPHMRKALQSYPSSEFINSYGPTECTTFSTFYKITPSFINQNPSSIPIGRPLNHVQLLIMNEAGSLQKSGEIGELCIGGAGLARGYLNNPQLTSQKFIEYKTVVGNQRVYRTGDLVRQNAEGLIEFLGRIDQQVKISGYRIELGEIETCLLDHPNIKQAAVIAVETGTTKKLVAFIVTKKALINPEIKKENKMTCEEDWNNANPFLICKIESKDNFSIEIKRLLAKKLPPYMIPSAFHQITALPLTSNGKLDRQYLVSHLLKN